MAATSAATLIYSANAATFTPLSSPGEFTKTDQSIAIDGHLNEHDWSTAQKITESYEVYPANVGEPTVQTEVSFLHDDRNVYVAIRALDPKPLAIRSSFVRRDQVDSDQDYVEILLDPQNTRQSALFFRVNARGIVTDGRFDEAQQARNNSPDIDFDVATSIDAQGWTAEFRLPLSSLRYQLGVKNTWAYVIYRNLPRNITATISSARIPRGANCVLCYANTLSGIEAAQNSSPLSIIPYVTYSKSHEGDDADAQTGAGIDLTWKPADNIVVDATLFPDFSQIEADDLQLTANRQFALVLAEKRPFFLEGQDLFSTPVPAVYTRTFTDPDVGARITGRSARYDYTAIALRDAGGGTVIEPGPINSQAALQDFESTALVGRSRFIFSETTLGLLATARFNDDGSENIVLGADSVWSPSNSNQITAQYLKSETRNPNRPDLLESWRGQRLSGAAGTVGWTHSVDTWNTDLSYAYYSPEFRAWNGIVSQVGISSLSARGGVNFYPKTRLLTLVSPTLSFSRIDNSSGTRLTQSISPGITIRGAHDTIAILSWSPGAQNTTLAGLRSYSSYSLGITSSPFSWMPGIGLAFTGGETLDTNTGAVGDGQSILLSIPIRLSRLELRQSFGYQTLDSRSEDAMKKRLFTERDFQFTATWHFSSKLNLRAQHQGASFSAPPRDGVIVDTRTENVTSSLLLSYQSNWQTRYFLGLQQSDTRTSGTDLQLPSRKTVFAKISYVFSN